jgi:hypothetical protein
MRLRNSLLATAIVMATLGFARDAHAAAEVHRFNVIFSMRPTSLNPDEFNAFIDQYNLMLQPPFTPISIEPLDRISYGWLFDAQIRYLTRANIAIEAGVGQLRSKTKREILPFLGSEVLIQSEVLSVPIHAGASYYFAPYNQGDFQARAYLGGGVLSQVYNRGRLSQVTTGFPPEFGQIPSYFKWSSQRDAPGYYLEGGVHMFFASRFSVILGATYRSAEIRQPLTTYTCIGCPGLPNDQPVPVGSLFDLDFSGYSARLGLALGL